MKAAMLITGRKVTKKALGVITDDFIRLMEAGRKHEMDTKTVRHAITALKEVVINTATPNNMSVSNCSIVTGQPVGEEDHGTR